MAVLSPTHAKQYCALLALSLALAGCGAGGGTELAATPAFSNTSAQAAAQSAPALFADAAPTDRWWLESATDGFQRTKTPITFEVLQKQMATDDPPFTRDLTPFRTDSKMGNKVEVSFGYETPEIPVLVKTEPFIRDKERDHQMALIAIEEGGQVVELVINVTPGMGPKPVPFHLGDRILVRGEYIITAPSQKSQIDGQHHDVLHWTHHSDDPARHPEGWINHQGVIYK